MDAPHVIIVYYKGRCRIAQYGQHDGYPSGQGLAVLNFARDAQFMHNLKAALEGDVLYEPSKQEVKEFKSRIAKREEERTRRLLAGAATGSDAQHPSPFDLVCPSLSTHTGSRILNIVAGASQRERIPVVLEKDCILWAKWGWVLDLDLGVLECWESGHAGAISVNSTRFDHLRSRARRRPALMASFPLDDLPDDATFYRECGTR